MKCRRTEVGVHLSFPLGRTCSLVHLFPPTGLVPVEEDVGWWNGSGYTQLYSPPSHPPSLKLRRDKRPGGSRRRCTKSQMRPSPVETLQFLDTNARKGENISEGVEVERRVSCIP